MTTPVAPSLAESVKRSASGFVLPVSVPPPPSRKLPAAADLGRDLVGGGISTLITLCFSLSFAAMIFTGPLAGDLRFGISMALTSASITVILVALLSPFQFAIAGPDSRSAAVQSALAGGLATTLVAQGRPIAVVLVALSLSTLFTGAVLYACGRLHIGRWIRYVPYPVIGGFLASTGWTLVIGGIRVITNRPVSLSSLPQFVQPTIAGQLAVGILVTLVMLAVLGRTKHFLALPGLLVVATLLVHVVRAVLGVPVAQAQRSGWLLEMASGGQFWLLLRDVDWSQLARISFEGATIGNYFGSLLVLVAVTAIGVLVTGTAIEVATRTDADLDQELKSHGIANLASGTLGGLVGQNAIARSMINLQAGGKTRLSGAFAGTLCLIIELTKPEIAGYLARPVMGATLAYLGLRLLYEWVVKARSNMDRIDYLLVVSMLGLIVVFGFVVGLLVGIVVSCLIFAVNYSRISVIRVSFTLDEYTSKVMRSPEAGRTIREYGRQHWVLRLRGYLFFGSVVRLVSIVRERLESGAANNQPLRTLVLDFAGVIGIDSSAALTLVKLRQRAESSRLKLIFTSLQPEMERLLRREKCLRDDQVCVALPELDRALERCEEAILAESQREAALPSISKELAVAMGGEEIANSFLTYAERVALNSGEYVMKQGDPSLELYVIESGRVSILLERPNQPPLRLRSLTSNTCLGEIGLYRKGLRTASVVADEPTVVYRLRQSELTRMEDNEPKVAMAFHIFIIKTLADRLVASDKAIAALER